MSLLAGHSTNHISLTRGNIAKAKVDAIVNAANPTLAGGGGVDGAIHRAAGPELLAECLALPEVSLGVRCPTGESRITGAGDLSAKYVIHTVGPIFQTDANPPQSLENAYRSALNLALENQCRSVALPAISCSAYGFPWSDAARIAVTVCSEPQYTELDLTFYLYLEELLLDWQLALAALEDS